MARSLEELLSEEAAAKKAGTFSEFIASLGEEEFSLLMDAQVQTQRDADIQRALNEQIQAQLADDMRGPDFDGDEPGGKIRDRDWLIMV
jgi:hypothetical protein